jgi:hypothetical protein
VRRLAASETVKERKEVSSMRLTARDAIATGFTATAVFLWTNHVIGTDMAGLSGVRPVAGAVLGLGFAAALASDITTDPLPPAYLWFMTALGMTSALAGLAAIVSGWEIPLAILTGALALLWITATVRHYRLNPPEMDGRVLQARIDAERQARAAGTKG